MSTTYTDSLRLAKQSFNSNVNTWGDVVNNQFDVLDAGITGIANLLVTGSVTINLTTSATDGSESLSKQAILSFTGTPTSDVSVTTPAVSKIYAVVTSLAVSSHSIFIHPTGSNIGVTCSASDKVIMFCDGTDMKLITRGIDTSQFLLATNNLSDLTNVSAALVNLGINASVLGLLNGLTASAAELNILDGCTLSVGELNLLDGLTASAAELNILDGINLSVSAGILNLLDGLAVSAGAINALVCAASAGGTLITARTKVFVSGIAHSSVINTFGGIATVSTLANNRVKVTFTSAYSSANAYIPVITAFLSPDTAGTNSDFGYSITSAGVSSFNFNWTYANHSGINEATLGIMIIG